jgi:pimeloyl-ACP methyl ester carboxylesterase
LLSWHAAALRPDVFRSVASLSVGFPSFLTGPVPPLAILADRMGGAFHYILYFQEPGIAEAEMEADVRGALAKIFWASSGEAPEEVSITFQPTPLGRTTLLAETPLPPPGAMPWLTDEDLGAYVSAFSARGFSGPLSWYRAMDLGWRNLGQRRSAKVTVPALYIVGTHDVVYRTTGGLLARMKDAVPGLDRIVTLEGCGHWTQQERPEEVASELVEFFRRHG